MHQQPIACIAEFLNATFWQNLVCTFVGAFLGFWLALLAEKSREKTAKCKAAQKLVSALSKSLGSNIGLLEQAVAQLKRNEIPTYLLDAALLDFTAYRSYEIIESQDVCKLISSARFEVNHFNLKLEYLRSNLASAAGDNLRTQIIGSLLAHSDIVRDVLKKAQAALETSLGLQPVSTA